MDSKLRSSLDKISQDKSRGNLSKALKRVNDTLKKHSGEIELYIEGADICMENGEPMQSVGFLKRATVKFPSEKDRINGFAREKLKQYNDPMLGKYLLESAVKKRDLNEAVSCLDELQDRTVRELLHRSHTKRQSLTSAEDGGHSLIGELATNTLCEALLCLRLGRLKEAITGLVGTLDDKPVENRTLQPFIAELQKQLPNAGRIQFAYGCSLIASKDIEGAMDRFVSGARMEPALVDESLSRVRCLIGSTDDTSPETRNALVELLLIGGNVVSAVEMMNDDLKKSKEAAPGLMNLIRPHLDEIDDTLLLHYLYMDAAIASEQMDAVCETARQIAKQEQHRNDVFEWLTSRSKSNIFPANILLLHGQLALEQSNFTVAIDSLKAVCGNSQGDIPKVLRMTKPYAGKNAKLKSFHDELAGARTSNEIESAPREVEFEHFENNDFQFGPKEAVDDPEPASDSFEPVHDIEENATHGSSREAIHDPDFDLTGSSVFTQTSKTEDDDIVWDVEDDEGKTSPSAKSEGEQSFQMTEDHVNNVANALYASGAATFFHVDDSDDMEEGQNEEKVVVATEIEPAPEPAPLTFEDRFERFLDGHLENREILSLIGDAFEMGARNELRELLYFEPSNTNEEFEKRRYQVEYHILRDSPKSALEVLTSTNLIKLEDEQKRAVRLKTALCQRMMNDFGAAHRTLTKLTCDYPESSEFERLAKRNYEQYLQDQCNDAPVLEKTTSLVQD